MRGSIPTPGPRTLKYGGNTSCVEIIFPDRPKFILDAGSGIRELGKALLEPLFPVKAHIFLTHFHWDHIQGLPFFRPAFKSENHFVIYGSDEPNVELSNIISMQMDPIYFPVAVEDMRANLEFHSLKEETFKVEDVLVQTKFMNHPGYTFGYRYTFEDKSIVYISDNEPFFQSNHNISNDNSGVSSLEDRFENFVDDKEGGLIRFISGADLLIHDAQYFPEEYQDRITWGHSPYTYTVDIAIKGGVKNLVLFHHDPDHTDQMIDKKADLSRLRLKEKDYNIRCLAAREGEIVEL
ncbi:MAG: MBL fold metallo-hydrolase [Calditrichae bacterium]|nr:MBL fold metallo-hydrolase [Calditrichia bacterium]